EVNDYMPRFMTFRQEYYCPSELHRKIRVLTGNPKIRVQLDARPNYALGQADYNIIDNYIKITSNKGEYNSFYLYSNLDYEKILNGEAIELDKYSYFLLSYHEKLEKTDNDKLFLEYEKTKSYWLDWVQRTNHPEKYKEQITRSAITLKLLMFQRTGAVIAAATTSLPEIIGKERNWDYRFCWIRDAAMIIDTYIRIGHIESANGFFDFILNRMMLKHEDISVMYGINGEEELIEKELDHLAGYKDSKPVRIGNDAYRQKQNDLYGELIETIYTYFVVNRRSSFQVNEEIWTMTRSLVNRVRDIWYKPDAGIWERREAVQHYVHSKLMNWVAMDRAVKIAKYVNKPRYIKAWQKLADEIKEDILAKGWNDKLKSFTMYYGSEYYDASNLLMLHYGFLDKNDPRIISTVEQSYKHLVQQGFTFRYIAEDEFGAPENAFVVCTFWMINALYLIGEERKAREMFENIEKCCNHLGLFAEDVEIASKRLTGNFPQGYSHLAYIQTILLLETDYNWSDAFKINMAASGY
ncbi:MAG: glycoside hydrolase family 15 protein, partial [Candidatus Omnitrophica bacterium]|nr:glycoside hydrolase family 15 protein [Candidatus Omnitrophota bacterium]